MTGNHTDDYLCDGVVIENTYGPEKPAAVNLGGAAEVITGENLIESPAEKAAH